MTSQLREGDCPFAFCELPALHLGPCRPGAPAPRPETAKSEEMRDRMEAMADLSSVGFSPAPVALDFEKAMREAMVQGVRPSAPDKGWTQPNMNVLADHLNAQVRALVDAARTEERAKLRVTFLDGKLEAKAEYAPLVRAVREWQKSQGNLSYEASRGRNRDELWERVRQAEKALAALQLPEEG